MLERVVELEERVAFEMNCLESSLSWFGSLTPPAPVSLQAIQLEDGNFRTNISAGPAHGHSSSRTVRRVLNELRPVLFATCFTLQDQVAEWILEEHGEVPWNFKAKLQRYKELSGDSAFRDPLEAVANTPVARGFWTAYEKLVRIRNSISHGSQARVEEDGAFCVDDNGTHRSLSVAQQMAYAAFIFSVTKALLRQLVIREGEVSFLQKSLDEILDAQSPVPPGVDTLREVRLEVFLLKDSGVIELSPEWVKSMCFSHRGLYDDVLVEIVSAKGVHYRGRCPATGIKIA